MKEYYVMSLVIRKSPIFETQTESDTFLAPKLYPANLDRYLIRKSILDALLSARDRLRGTMIDVGCGQMPYKSLLVEPRGYVTRYIGIDFAENPIHKNKPDLCWQDDRIPLDAGSVDCAICTEVLEHCPDPDSVLNEIYRVLRPGGLLFLTVPFLWPLHEVPYDQYRYTPFSLRRHLESVGFSEVRLESTGGWDASLAQMLGLWARRSSLGRIPRLFLSTILIPIYRWLVKRDETRSIRDFREGTMLTGMTGTAVKPGD